MREYCVGVIGALGAVGGQMREILADSSINIGKVKMFERPELEGETAEFDGDEITCEVATPETLSECDVAAMSAGSAASEKLAPMAADAGCVVVDNSSQWRLDPEVPLVVPEVNPEDLEWHEGIVANPNCSTIQMVVALKPIHDHYDISRIVVSTYQAVSGSGVDAIEELKKQTEDIVNGKKPKAEVYPHQIAFNALPHIDVFRDNGYTKEEMKMVHETHKIVSEDIEVSPTAVRIPVYRSHAESVNVQTKSPIDPEEVRELLSNSPGVVVQDDPENDVYPLCTEAEGKNEVFVGRIRRDPTVENGLNFWVVSDNLRKGAALNTVQIAETMVERDLV
ncbi:MAG: aspartate-semialdehyde dehydrogenase [Candidatus Bipolaricaulota bacterium]|nr:aspartate-semialdehyde dehydrogenase [Candidatus Bipolaricaulota bacterium]MBS3791319.1 aspartate-semialdehyde dehydrogenase [Candidatus Bipolaricaulota bacterium]